jgi:lysophospholipase L1-like esterase
VNTLPRAGAPGARSRPAPTSVAMIGDSITEAAAPALQQVFTAAGFTSIVIDAKRGRRIDSGNGTSEPLAGAKVLKAMLAKGVQPDVWVFALGTNDVGHYSKAEEYTLLIEEMLDEIPADVPLIWVDAYVKSEPQATLEWNDLLATRLRARGHAQLASWSAAASDPSRDLLRSDDLHPNDNGTLVFADLVVKAVTSVR